MTKRWLTMLGILAAIAAVVWISLPESPANIGKGNQAVDFALPDLSGKTHQLPTTGEMVLLNFWATWCPPCRKEMPSMVKLHNRLAERGLKVVAISVDRNRNDLEGFVREYNLPFQVLHDADGSVSRQYGVFRYPETFLIDRQGKVRYHLIGAVDWLSASVLQKIEGMLNEPRSAEQSG
ncbi:MAG: peroxiredoxin family protein [Mariprofundaceae bacterium]